MAGDSGADRQVLRWHRRLRGGFATESAAYGSILISGVIAVSSTHGESAFDVLVAVLVTVIVFWGAHLYASTLTAPGEGAAGFREALGVAFRRELGMLGALVVPGAILLVGMLARVPDDPLIDAALWSGPVILALLGYVAFLRHGSPFWIRVLGALGTAAFGLVFVVLKALLH